MFYDLDFLLQRCYTEIDTIKQTNKTNRLLLTKPDVVFSNKKTYIRNFSSVCAVLNKDPQDVKSFFETEMNSTMTIDSNSMLVVVGRYTQSNVETVLTNYIKQFLLCSECKSTDTEIVKENRILFMNCKRCYAKRAIQ